MGTDTKIPWCDHTWNPFIGCTWASAGCDNCYAKAWNDTWFPKLDFGTPRRASKQKQREPLARYGKGPNKGEYKWKSGDTVFVCSLSDFWHENVPDSWRLDAFAIMSQRPDLTFMILTKRPLIMTSNDGAWMPYKYSMLKPVSTDNIWMGITAEDQKRLDFRNEILQDTPAARRFLSLEPLIGAIDILPAIEMQSGNGRRIHWVIVGGESGVNARPMHPNWVRAIRDRCVEYEIPFFFKQWGRWSPVKPRTEPSDSRVKHHRGVWLRLDGTIGQKHKYSTDVLMLEMNKHTSGRTLDGREWSQIPKREG